MQIVYRNGKEIAFFWIDMEVPSIEWNDGELESLKQDVEENYEDLSKLKTENIIKVFKLYAVFVMDNDMDSKFAGLWGILKQEEKELLDMVLLGYSQYDFGRLLWLLAESIGDATQLQTQQER